MNQIFNMDGPLYRGINKICNIVFLDLLFWLTSIPFFTMGTSFSAMYYTIQKVMKNDRGYIGSEYWRGIKSNFKKGTIVWILAVVVGVILWIDMDMTKALLDNAGKKIGYVYILFGAMLMLEVVWYVYIFSYMARIEDSVKVVLKNTAVLAFAHFPWSFVVLAFTAVVGFVLYLMPLHILPMVVFFLPVPYTMVINLIMEQIFKNYINEEDLEEEEEMNREYMN